MAPRARGGTLPPRPRNKTGHGTVARDAGLHLGEFCPPNAANYDLPLSGVKQSENGQNPSSFSRITPSEPGKKGKRTPYRAYLGGTLPGGFSPMCNVGTSCPVENSWISRMKLGSVRIREIHVGIRRNSSSFRAPKQAFFSFSTHYLPSVHCSPIQLRLIAHIRLSVVILRNQEPYRAIKIEFTSIFAELRTFFRIMRVPGNGPPSQSIISLPVLFLALVLRR